MAGVERRNPRIERAGFTLGGVFSSAVGVWTRNLPTFVVISAVCLLPSFVIQLKFPDLPEPAAIGEPGGYLWFGVSSLIGLLSGSITTAAVIHAVFKGLRGERVSALTSLRTGLSMLPQILVANLLVGMICALPFVPGFVLLIVDVSAIGMPAMVLAIPLSIMFAMTYYVVSAVVVSERVSPSRALARSSELTKGSRLRLLLLTVVIGVLFGVVGIVLGLAVSEHTLKTVLTMVTQIVSESFTAVLAAVVYHELRLSVDGVDRVSLESIFA